MDAIKFVNSPISAISASAKALKLFIISAFSFSALQVLTISSALANFSGSISSMASISLFEIKLYLPDKLIASKIIFDCLSSGL